MPRLSVVQVISKNNIIQNGRLEKHTYKTKTVYRTAQLEDNIQALNYIDVDKDNREPIGIGIHGRWSWYIFAIICDVYLCRNLHIL